MQRYPQQQHTDDGLLTTLAVLVIGGLAVAGIWYSFGPAIKFGLIQVATWLMIPPLWFSFLVTPHYVMQYNDVARFLYHARVTPDLLTPRTVGTVYSFLADTYYYVGMLPVLLWAYWLWRRPVALRYHHAMTLRMLVARNMKYYPEIRPAFTGNRDLLLDDFDSGPFARPVDYRLLAERHGLLLDMNGKPLGWRDWHSDINDPATYDQTPTGNPDEPRIPIMYPAPVLDGRACLRLFTEQLGARWQGLDDLPLFHRALFGVLAARIVRDKAAADAAIFQINRYWEEKKGVCRSNCRKALTLADKHLNHPWVQAVCKRHAYRSTVFSALLRTAQTRSGSFTTTKFLWLKVVDRPLFFAMNQVGRRVAWPEAGGVRAHLLAEDARQEPITTPVVEPAIRALAKHLADEGFLASEQTIRFKTPAPDRTATENTQKELV